MEPRLVALAVAAGSVLVGLLLLRWLKRRRDAKTVGQCKVLERDLAGKVVIVTGGSTGLGLETARQLAMRNATVVLGCRDLDRASKAVAKLLEVATMPVSSLKLDLDSLESIDSFVIAFRKKFDKLDILVNNAGVMGCPFTRTDSGIEKHFSTNHLGHFYLTNLLLVADRLQLSAPSRVLVVSSGYYSKVTHVDFAYATAATQPAGYTPTLGYAQSKLANCLHVKELARRLKATNIAVYAIRPGFVRGTELGRYYNRLYRFLATPLIWYFSRDLSQGVQTLLHCCLSDRESLRSGGLYADCRLVEYADTVTDENAKGLWQLSDQLVQQVKAQRG